MSCETVECPGLLATGVDGGSDWCVPCVWAPVDDVECCVSEVTSYFWACEWSVVSVVVADIFHRASVTLSSVEGNCHLRTDCAAAADVLDESWTWCSAVCDCTDEDSVWWTSGV